MARIFTTIKIPRTVVGRTQALAVAGNSRFARIANLTGMELFRAGKHSTVVAPVIAPKEIDPEVEKMRAAAESSKLEDQLTAASSMKTPNGLLLKLLGKQNDTVALAALETLRKIGVRETDIMAAAVENNMALKGNLTPGLMLAVLQLSKFATEIAGFAVGSKVLSSIVPDNYTGKMLFIASQSTDTPAPQLLTLVVNVKTHIALAAIKTLREKKISESDIMERAARGFNEVQLIAAKNMETPNDSLAALFKHPNNAISDAALATLKAKGVDNSTLMGHAAKGFNHTQAMAANSNETPTASLLELVTHPNTGICMAAIRTLRARGTDEALIMERAAKGFNDTQFIAAGSDKTPIDSQLTLVKHPNTNIALAAINTLRARGIEEKVLMESAASGFNRTQSLAANSEATPAASLFNLVKHPNDEICMAAIRTLRARGIKEAVIMGYAADGFNFSQLIAAQSAATSLECLRKLSGHVNRNISAAAAENLKGRSVTA